ncbi:MAG: hypothetical protein AB1941_05430 [Gemmatimonadota bacterium]
MRLTARALLGNPSFLSGLLLAALLAGAALVVEATIPAPGIAVALNGGLSAVQSKQIELVVDLTTLFINWGFAVIGANVFFLVSTVESKIRLRKMDLVIIELAIGCTLLSLLFGHLVITNTVKLLELDQFSAADTLVNRYVELQYWALVVGLVVTTLLVHGFFWRRQNESE